jgi:hypothetical protein
MEKRRLLLVIIAIWHVLIAGFAVSIIVNRVQYSNLIINQFRYGTYEQAIRSLLGEVRWYPEYYQRFKDIEWPVTSIFLIILTLVAIAGSIGLVLRKRWGRITGISVMWMTILFFLYNIVSPLLVIKSISSSEIFPELVLPILLGLVGATLCIFSIIHINKAYKKESLDRRLS